MQPSLTTGAGGESAMTARSKRACVHTEPPLSGRANPARRLGALSKVLQHVGLALHAHPPAVEPALWLPTSSVASNRKEPHFAILDPRWKAA